MKRWAAIRKLWVERTWQVLVWVGFGASCLGLLLQVRGYEVAGWAIEVTAMTLVIFLMVVEYPPETRDNRSVEEIYEQFVRYLDASHNDPDAISMHNPAFMEALGVPAPRWWRLGRWVGRRRARS